MKFALSMILLMLLHPAQSPLFGSPDSTLKFEDIRYDHNELRDSRTIKSYGLYLGYNV